MGSFMMCPGECGTFRKHTEKRPALCVYPGGRALLSAHTHESLKNLSEGQVRDRTGNCLPHCSSLKARALGLGALFWPGLAVLARRDGRASGDRGWSRLDGE